jgi:glycerol-3-phosphate acyltransferase PlsY
MFFAPESKRKGVHALALVLPVLYYFLPAQVGRTGLLVLTGIVIILDLLRLRYATTRAMFALIFGPVIRRHEVWSLTGATYLLFSSVVCVFVYDKPVAVAAISFLVLGDLMAAVIGRRIGRLHVWGKTVEGAVACFITCVLVAWAIPDLPLGVGMAGAIVATLVEVLPIPLDDNLSIPLLGGLAMQLLLL